MPSTELTLSEFITDCKIEVLGRVESSNVTLLVELEKADQSKKAIYKPIQGERPLADFAQGLYKREIASYQLSECLGWGLVPETIEHVGPHGVGSIQAFIDADFSQHYFSLLETKKCDETLKKICVFDFLANNTDRKASHILLENDSEKLFAIDHGLTFHSHYKLRTVIWDFAGQNISDEIIEDVSKFKAKDLAEYLNDEEIEATKSRVDELIQTKKFPKDITGGHMWPWPLF